MSPSYALAGKTVMVTGAGKGIGRAIAEAFAAQGCRVLAVDRDAATLQSLRDAQDSGPALASLACDLACDGLDGLEVAVEKLGGRIDVLVNNAGVEYPTPIADDGADAHAEWSALLQNNVGSMARA